MPTHMKVFSCLRAALVTASIFVLGMAFAQGNESALKMVKSLRLGQNLGSMSYRLAKVTTTYQGIASRLGPQRADELLRAELVVAVLKHQEQWDRNLALAWTPLMTGEEFESIAVEKQQSRFAAKFMALQNQAGAAMKDKSETLLTTVMTEALSQALEKAAAQK